MDDTEKLTEAVKKIQRRWRLYIDVQVFKYYKNLINFKNRGHPALILRSINPREAGLIDAASGIKVRFRLAGPDFPPRIYYKIYTERNIVDMCACSPKVYYNNSNKRKNAFDVNNISDDKTDISTDRSLWYKRIENNGWRLVSDRFFNNCYDEKLNWETSKEAPTFHPNKLQRKQDVQKQRKSRKIEWMKKMYKDGLLQSKVKEAQYEELVNEAVTGILTTANQEGIERLDTWEVDELLNWTVGLNFDDYLTEWHQIGTTRNSQYGFDNFRFETNSSDPYEVTFTLTSQATPNQEESK